MRKKGYILTILILLISSVFLRVQAQNPCPCSIFDPSSIPASIDSRDNVTGIELGMKFRTTQNGYIYAVRFYKGPLSNGTFTSHLWSSGGSPLGSSTLTVSSGSGWQQINFDTPVAVTSGTTYVISYHSPSGYYPVTDPFFSSDVLNGPLRALANGEDGENGVYSYSASPVFPTTNFQSSNYWVDVVFDTAVVIDTTAPVITHMSAVAQPDGTAVITWKTNELSDSRIDYDTLSSSLSFHSSVATLDTLHSISLSGLVANKMYYFRVTSRDASNNSTTYPASPAGPRTFVVPGNCFADIDSTQFNAGTRTDVMVSRIADGEIVLQPAVSSEFDVLPPPTEWNSFAWTGGSTTLSSGMAIVDGCRYNTEPATTTYGPGTSLEFTATFGASSFQHIGFGGGTNANGSGGIYNGENSWAMFSTGNTNNSLHARTYIYGGSTSDFLITGISNIIGTPHRFRIDWKTDGSFEYYVDGNLVRTEPLVISTQMRPAASDYNIGGEVIAMDWVRVSPYASTGTFESRVYDAGTKKSWDNNITWNSELPPGTSVAVSVRTGNVAVPDVSWSEYKAIAASGNPVGALSRYIQYKVVLSTGDSKHTPVVSDVSISCSPVIAPEMSLNPDSTSLCEGGNAVFISAASGNPEPSVYWQVSANEGLTWSDINDATNDTLSFTPTVTDHHNLYRAIWLNEEDSVISFPARLALKAPGTWLGTADSSWSNPVNWCGGLPTSSNDVIIPAEVFHMPVIETSNVLSSRNIHVQTGATLTIRGTLEVAENVINDGAIVAASGSMVLNGTTAQVISGNAFEVMNLTLDNALGATLSTQVGVTGSYIPTLGVLTTNGNLVILSSASGSGRIAQIQSGADITGNVTVQRYVPAVTRRYRMLSPSTTPFSFNHLKDDIFVTGIGGADSGFDASSQNQTSIYTFEETIAVGRGWKPVTGINTPLAPGYGALVFIRGDRTLSSPEWYTAPYVPQNEVTIDFTGSVNKGTIAPAIHYTNTGSVADDGWNLVGNPYASQIDWNSVNKTNLSPFYYVMNPVSGSYVAEDGSNLIASGQGFFVQAIGSSPAISFSETDKATALPQNYFKSAPQKLKVTMTKDALNSDAMWIHFSYGAIKDFDISEDAIKFTNSEINIGSLVHHDSIPLQINSVSPDVIATDTFRIFANASNGRYSLTFEGTALIGGNYQAVLRDHFMNVNTNIVSGLSYEFDITSNPASKGNERFSILFKNNHQLPVRLNSFSAQKSEERQLVKLMWDVLSEKELALYEVERSTDNANFMGIGKVEARNREKATYTYDDVTAYNLHSQTIYYRLKQVAGNGQAEYSQTVRVMFDNKTGTFASFVYPNPVSDELKVAVNGQKEEVIECTISDISGRVIAKTKMVCTYPGANTFVMKETAKLKSGVYFLHTKSENGSTATKFIKE